MSQKIKHTYCFDLTQSKGNGLTQHLPSPRGEYQNFYDDNYNEVVEMLVRWCSNYIVYGSKLWNDEGKVRLRVLFDSRSNPYNTMTLSAIFRGLYRWIDEVIWYDVNDVGSWNK